MKRFGTLFPFVESQDNSLRLGRYVANYEFLKALLNFSSFDEFHLYCLSPQHFNSTVSRLQSDISISNEAKAKVQLYLFDALEENLQSVTYHCFHLGGWGYFWGGTVALRNRCAVEPFPVTAVIHSLNSTDTISELYKLVTSPHAEFDSIICTSESGRQVMQKGVELIAKYEQPFIGNFSVIPLGYDSIFDREIDKCNARKELGFKDDDLILLYLGRLSPSSKADLFPFLQACRGVVDTYGDRIKIVLAGGVEGSELRLHKDMIHDLSLDFNVRLMINFDTCQKPLIYAAADIYVAPSDNIQETFGISIIEAMASGLPVIASDMDGYRELVRHGETGLKIPTIWHEEHSLESLHECMDPGVLQMLLAQSMVVVPAKMEEAIVTLIDNPQLRLSMGKRGAEIAQQHYRWETVIHAYEKHWDQLKENAVQSTVKEEVITRFAPDFSYLFSHYTTDRFSTSMICSIRPAGQKVLNSGSLPSLYSELPLVLEQQIIADTLTAIQQCKMIVAELPHNDHQKFQTTLLWMAKYDLILLENV